MERLTNVGTQGEIYITDNDYTRSVGQIQAALERLKEYEDLEEQKKLVKFKAAVGDEVFYIKKNCTAAYACDHTSTPCKICPNWGLVVESLTYSYTCTELEHHLYYTREDAEKALAIAKEWAMKGEDADV